jgi:hypothetical protein
MYTKEEDETDGEEEEDVINPIVHYFDSKRNEIPKLRGLCR